MNEFQKHALRALFALGNVIGNLKPDERLELREALENANERLRDSLDAENAVAR